MVTIIKNRQVYLYSNMYKCSYMSTYAGYLLIIQDMGIYAYFSCILNSFSIIEFREN